MTALDLPQKILGRAGFHEDGFLAQTAPLGKVSEPGQVNFTGGNRPGKILGGIQVFEGPVIFCRQK